MEKITPFLWFNDKAEEAAKFYVKVFKNSRFGEITLYSDESSAAAGRPVGWVMTVSFALKVQEFTTLNGGPVMEALLKMTKLKIATLQKAYNKN